MCVKHQTSPLLRGTVSATGPWSLDRPSYSMQVYGVDAYNINIAMRQSGPANLHRTVESIYGVYIFCFKRKISYVDHLNQNRTGGGGVKLQPGWIFFRVDSDVGLLWMYVGSSLLVLVY